MKRSLPLPYQWFEYCMDWLSLPLFKDLLSIPFELLAIMNTGWFSKVFKTQTAGHILSPLIKLNSRFCSSTDLKCVFP